MFVNNNFNEDLQVYIYYNGDVFYIELDFEMVESEM